MRKDLNLLTDELLTIMNRVITGQPLPSLKEITGSCYNEVKELRK